MVFDRLHNLIIRMTIVGIGACAHPGLGSIRPNFFFLYIFFCILVVSGNTSATVTLLFLITPT